MLENALRSLCNRKSQIKESSVAKPEPAKTARDMLYEELEKDAGFKDRILKFVTNVKKLPSHPMTGWATLGVLGYTIGKEFLERKEDLRASDEQTMRVLNHLKSLYPDDQSDKVEEAYSAIVHVAPTISQNPLIARSIVNNMMKEITRPDFQLKGHPVGGDITTLNTVSKMEEARSKALAHAAKPPNLVELISRRMSEGIGTVESIGKLPGLRPTSEADALKLEHDKIRKDNDLLNRQLTQLRIRSEYNKVVDQERGGGGGKPNP